MISTDDTRPFPVPQGNRIEMRIDGWYIQAKAPFRGGLLRKCTGNTLSSMVILKA